MERHISPSILAADFLNLGAEIEKINKSNASWVHCDVMDGSFVPNISFGIPIVEAVARISSKPLDAHLMIVEPAKYIDRFCALGVDILTVHLEACKHMHRAIQQIKENNVKAGISINPSTPVSSLSEVISDLDIVLVMSVNPGFGGQAFIDKTYERVSECKELIETKGSKALIQVDGGVNLENARQLFDSGVDILVAGTTVFRSEDKALTIDKLLAV